MALSASAPPEIEATIIDSLKLDNAVQVSKRLDRPNIYLSVSPMSGLKVSKGLSIRLYVLPVRNGISTRYKGEQ